MGGENPFNRLGPTKLSQTVARLLLIMVDPLFIHWAPNMFRVVCQTNTRVCVYTYMAICIYIYMYIYHIRVRVTCRSVNILQTQKNARGKNARTTHTQTHIFARAYLHIHVRTHTYPHHLCTLKTHNFENVVSIPTRFSARTTSYDAIMALCIASCVKPEHCV